MRVVVVGTDSWRDIDAIWRQLEPLWEEHGAKLVVAFPERERGACRLVDALCATAGITRVKVPSNHSTDDEHQLRLLLRMMRPDLVLAFHPFIHNSHTTKLAKSLAEEMGHDVIVVSG